MRITKIVKFLDENLFCMINFKDGGNYKYILKMGIYFPLIINNNSYKYYIY